MSFRTLFTNRWVGIVLALIVFGMGWSATRAIYERMKLQQDIKDLEANVSAQQKELKDYQQLLDNIHNFTYIEQEARLKFGLKKPGEQVFVIPDKLLASNAGNKNTVTEISNAMKWWNYFFN